MHMYCSLNREMALSSGPSSSSSSGSSAVHSSGGEREAQDSQESS